MHFCFPFINKKLTVIGPYYKYIIYIVFLATANQNRTTSKVVDVPFFYGRDDEDPYEWCRLFEAAFAANGWPDNRKIALAAGFLKEAARDWYEEDREKVISKLFRSKV
ncbi:hypothetical protein RirG_160810 [Rhizophagus irregularis DAOM 197198w]|uniref:Uncharacterized protein n=1 Tax=Rhizophagus irregularis (strain DAOM 197198w) TaxID=1432141 RepID=A0A015KRM4_RHIIW|nr:hypothetical protein RirG_160810 [Rhizophagus irregularis DAOM 197198w]